jgi:hypothetical protein
MATRVAVRGCYVAAMTSGIVVVAEHASILFVCIVVLAAAVCLCLGEIVVRQGGIWETSVGITTRGLSGVSKCHLRWQEIKEFRGVRSRVYVVLRDGRVLPLVGVAQGYRIAWNGGETRDVVGVLNEQLNIRTSCGPSR